MRSVPIHQVIEGLNAIPDADFTCQGVYDFLAANPVDVETIERFFFFSDSFYTRNLIFKNERYEAMTICWEKGQVSRVHNHSDQKCWMTVPVGKLKGQNFAVDAIDESRGYCRLVETDSYELSNCAAAAVELEEPIHQILNLAEYDERAVSLHIYSKPYATCISYCRDTDTFKEVALSYTSIDGKLCDGVTL